MSGAKRYPNESDEYRRARDELLRLEYDLREQLEKVAEARRAMPLGGEIKEDYLFEEIVDGNIKQLKLSELFGSKRSLFLYSFMYGPGMDAPCPMCTALLDSLEGQAEHLTEKIGFAVIAKNPPAKLRAFAKSRNWTRLRLLSSSKNSYNSDYLAESDGNQLPTVNVFTRQGSKIHHFWASELLFHGFSGGDARHLDLIWPLWNVLDLTPEGRGA